MFSRVSNSTKSVLNAFLPRYVHVTRLLRHGEYEQKASTSPDDVVTVNVIGRDGSQSTMKGKIGDNLMYLAHRHNVEIEGACEASLACSTCHVYVGSPYYDMLPEPVEEEEDMLDLAVFLRDNSRLSCQIYLTKELDGMTITLPKATRNFYVDGHVPKPH
ncbi:hypothetical protein CRM22_000817 [Opisthorchis felineus]|uniref:2Fe-2S ferredoxin-type domain-containing protein n=2 Tax=Opisthorchis felineus TaxID=147828 RepID=A0A4S2MDD7_OPIFE|nr:hypothetical protein CRM22_000817 [Opisthorchis felineus]